MTSGPQHSPLFRAIAFLSRLQLAYLFRNTANPQIPVVGFVFTAGAAALATITIAAYLTELPLLFPPLGPTAFILFYTPMAVAASPRSAIMAHTMAVVAGTTSLWLVELAFPHGNLSDPASMNWHRVVAIAMSMGLTGAGMILLRCVHPPAAASALIAAMGYLGNATQIIGLPAAVVLLVLEAFLFNRLLGGLPYPVWRADTRISRMYGALAGIPDDRTSFWHQLTGTIFQRR